MDAAHEGEQVPQAGPSGPDLVRHVAAVAAGAAALATAGCQGTRRLRQSVAGPSFGSFAPLPAGVDLSLPRLALGRAAFGPAPGELARVAAIGPAAYLEEQLADDVEEEPAVAWRVNGLDVQEATRDAPDVLDSLSDEQLVRETQQAALLRAVYSRHQLREVLADFWSNHLNIYSLKGHGRVLVPADVETVVRRHALGSFRDMLVASAHSPAMLSYLDNVANRRGVPNENYARELMELHSLGVHSGYTQRDVQAVARCFTGWTVRGGWRRGQFEFDAAQHDDGPKRVPFLGMDLPPSGGQRDAEQVLDHLATHPATARHVASRLCQRFLGCQPWAIVARAARAYLRSGGGIRATLRPILLDGLCTPGVAVPVVKRPLELVVSALRALGADTDGGAPLQRHLAAMGQPLYQWPMPDGFPEAGDAWAGAMLPRWNFAIALAADDIAGTRVDLPALVGDRQDPVSQIVEALAGHHRDAPEVADVRGRLRAQVRQARAAGAPQLVVLAEVAALVLCSQVCQVR